MPRRGGGSCEGACGIQTEAEPFARRTVISAHNGRTATMMREHEILLGKAPDGGYLKFGGSEHIALHARSGAGKTSSLTIPTCFTWRGSLVVLDVKREAFTATAGYRARLGQDVYLLDPAAQDGRSHRWDPFAAVQRSQPERFDQIARMGFQLFPEHYVGPGNASADRFWEPAGRSAFVAVAALLAETPGEPLTMSNVLRVFTRGDGIEWLARKIAADRPSPPTPASSPTASAIISTATSAKWMGSGRRSPPAFRFGTIHGLLLPQLSATSTYAIFVANQ